MIYWYIWEAYLIFQMTTQELILPFNNLDELLEKTDFRVAIKPGGSQELTFRTSPFPVVQRVYEERIQPHMEVFASYRGEDNTFIECLVFEPGVNILPQSQ